MTGAERACHYLGVGDAAGPVHSSGIIRVRDAL